MSSVTKADMAILEAVKILAQHSPTICGIEDEREISFLLVRAAEMVNDELMSVAQELNNANRDE